MDPRALRDVFGRFVTGVTVITTTDTDGRRMGVTANSFSSVSLDPPLVLWSQATNSRSYPVFRDAERFVVNILADHQKDVSQRFASSGADKFDGIDSHQRHHGLPALDGCCAYIECRKVATYPGGDHVVYLGEVTHAETHARRPLAFSSGRYAMTLEHDADWSSADEHSEYVAHIGAVRIASAHLGDIARSVGATVGLGVWGNQGPTLIRWEPWPRETDQALRTGLVASPLFSATGLAFCAHLPEELTADVIGDAIRPYRNDGQADMIESRHRAACAEIRRTGFARSRPLALKDAIGLAVPVFDRHRRMILSLSAVTDAATSEVAIADLQGRLTEQSAALTNRFGHAQ